MDPTSALITDDGERVLLRVDGRFYQLGPDELRQILNSPDGPPGLGITIDRGRVHFEFGDGESATLTSAQLRRRLGKRGTRSAVGFRR